MKVKSLFIVLFLLFLGKNTIYSQESKIFKPNLWLYNPQKPHDSLTEFDKLNFHKDLGINKKSLWSSSKKLNNSQQLFLVYKSKKDENLVSFISSKRGLFLEGKMLRINDSVDIAGYNESYGELLDIKFSNMENGRFWMNPQLKDSRIFELVLVDPQSPSSTNEIRTYLSLKYGIDLIDYKQYTYNDKKLWDGGDKAYNSHIFGLAAMGRFNLQPSKSVHSKDQDLIVSVNKEQRKSMDEGSYVLFGNNRKRFVFNTKTKFNEKQWLAQTNKQKVLADISIPLNRLGHCENCFNEYELVVGAKGSDSEIYSATVKDSLLVFHNVAFNNGGSIVRLKEYKSDIKLETESNCDQLQLKIEGPSKIDGFRLSIADDQGKTILTELTRKNSYTVQNNTSAYFDVTLEYNRKKVSKRIPGISGVLQATDLKKHYTLSDDILEIHLENPDKRIYEWYKGDVLIGNGNQITLTKEGTYSLNVSTGQDCTIVQNFSVGKSMNNEQWRVFPSPADISEEVQVAFELDQESAVDLAIYQSDGKLVKTLNVGTIQNKTISLGSFATSSGVYMVVAYIDQIPQFKKIIIK